MFSWASGLRAGLVGVAAALGAGLVQAEPMVVGGTGSALESIRQLAAAYAKTDKDFQITVLPSIGSAGALKGLADRSVDMGLIARPLKDNEKSQGLQAVAVAQTPVVIASSRRTEKGLTAAQLEDMYAGKLTRWSDNSPVRLVLRPLTETDNQLIFTLSPGMKAAVEAASQREGLLVASTDQESGDGLEKLSGSLGTTTLSLVLSEKRNLAVLSIDGVAPLAGGKVNAHYPLMKPLFVAMRDDAKPMARKFLAFVQSPAGGAMLEKFGYAHGTR